MFKKVLSILLASVLMLSTISFTVFAEDTDIIEVGAGKTCTTWSAAVAAAADNNSDKAITYHIYGKVEVDQTGWVSPRGTSGATTINFVGMTDDAEICISNSTPTIIATNGMSDMVAINYKGLILSRPNGSWAADYAHANQFFTTWMRGANDGVVTYTDCTFSNGVCANTFNETTFTECTFKNPDSNALWIMGGEVEVIGGTFEAKKGVKTYNDNPATVINADISGATFDIEATPAVIASAIGEVTLEEVDTTACEYGIIENGVAGGAKANVTIDGENPVYVATTTNKYGVTIYTTDAEYAESVSAEAVKNNKESEVSVPAAQIGAVPYATLEAAIADAKANGTIKIASGTYDAFDVLVDGVTITGMTDDTEITVNSIPNCAFIGINANGVTVENIKFIVPEACVKTGWYNAVIGYWSKNFDAGSAGITGVDVKNCDFVNEGSDVDVAIFNFDSFEVSGNTFENFGTGITAMNDGSAMGTVTIKDNTFTKVNEPVNVYWGQAGDDADSLTLTGNNFVSAKDADEIKITIDDYAAESAGQAGISTIDMSGNTYGAETEVLLVDAAATVTTEVTEALANAENAALTSRYDSVARIGNKYYASLHTAITEAASDETVEVLNDITFAEPWNQIWNKENLTIKGNNHTLTFTQPNYSNGNGDAIIYGATNLNVNDLVIKFAENDTTSVGFYTNGGAFTNVDFYNGMFAIANTGAVAITDCTFNNQAWIAIYSNDDGNTTGTTITGCDFTDTRAYIARSNEVISGNEIICDEKEEIALAMTVAPSATSTITNNTFNEGTQLELYNSESTITNNKILGTIYSAGDLSSTTVTDNKLSDAAEEVLNNSGLDVESVDPSFEVDGEKFFTLTDAIAVAEQGSAITLYADTDITAEDYSSIVIKELTLTLGDYTLTSETELADTSFITVPSGYKVKKTSTDGVYVYSIAKKTSSKKPSGNSGSYYPSYDYDSDKYVPETEDKKDLSDFPFTDVASDFWGYNGIAYCWQNNIMNGMTGTTFEPETSLSRAMLVTMLYRLAGSPEVETTENEWYSAARVWAMNNTISDGTNMNDEITREQLATMLCRYAAKQGVDTGISADLAVFTDSEGISDWAYTSVSWAVRSGLMNGMGDGTLSPNSGATRAQVAAIFMRAADIITK